MQRFINIIGAIAIVTLLALAFLQQRAIDSLVLGQVIETHRAAEQHKIIASLQRRLYTLEHGRARRLSKVERQVDLLIAMRRGPAHAKKLMRDKKVRFYLGL